MRNRLVLAACIIVLASSLYLSAQSSDASASPQGTLRILFDGQGGFKLLRFTGDAYVSVLNPSSSNPVQFEVYRDDLSVPRSLIESKSTSQRAPQGSFPGPAFSFGGLRVDLFGVDLDAAAPGTAAIRYDVQNTSDSIQNFSLKFILDTYLGESTDKHFIDRSAGNELAINDEKTLTTGEINHLLISKSDAQKNGFVLVVASKKGIGSAPDRIVLSNIRRLQNAGKTPDFEDGRQFNLLPFSVNDSAIGIYYTNLVLLPKQALSVDIVVSGNLDLAENSMQSITTALSNLTPIAAIKSLNPQTSPSPLPQKTVDRPALLKRLNSLIEELNKLIDSGSYKTATIERMLEEINELRDALAGKS